MSRLRVGLLGAGLQAVRLATAIDASGNASLRAVGVPTAEVSRLGGAWRGVPACPAPDVAADPDLDAIVVATPPDSHEELVRIALAAGKNVLCEKPLALNSDSAAAMTAMAAERDLLLWCGFNHRYHRAISALIDVLGDERVLSIRLLYGISGRGAGDGGWRWDRSRVSGGQLMEQGVHAIDLVMLIMPGLDRLTAAVQSPLWGEPSLEEEAVVLLRDKAGRTATVQSTCLLWINTFRLEVTTAGRCLRVDGLGPAYGPQTLTTVDRPKGMEPFAERTVHFRGGDVSFNRQWEAFTAAIDSGATGDPCQGARRIAVVETCYAAARERSWLRVPEQHHPAAGA